MKFIIFGIGVAIGYSFLNNKPKNKGKVSEWSFQRYARFYGDIFAKDEFFEQKIETIIDLINNQKVYDIKFIAKEAKCTYEECILKIRYLKNKRKIENFYIDYINGVLKKCSLEERKLLRKYSSYLYRKHMQIDEIARSLPNATADNLESLKKQILDDLIYLDEKGLINGIILNKVDGTIVYYHLEKHKKSKDFISINCSNCGALNDVNRGSKVRCEYCNTIISSSDEKDNL